ncbi:hypothetical protein [Emticicia sp. TH156]|uniref:hypothetical protein n=1 Tax=Emticicia sp. TH156 TaxID=2067454 RepID=UPI000C75EE83|nr:hypothetical protein [Emticicia sp. TH156]PLK44665.1 hypothetical protein C0V77_09375 [Emticicia sp. TH156]
MSVAEILYEQYKVLPENIQKELKALINGKDESVSVSIKALKGAVKEVKKLKEGKTQGRPISELFMELENEN